MAGIVAAPCGRNNANGSQHAPSACIVALLIGNVLASLLQDQTAVAVMFAAKW